MHVLFTSQGYPPTISGVTLVVQRLAHALVERGHTVTVLAGSERYRPYESVDEGARVVRLTSHRNPYWPANPVPTVSLDALEALIELEAPDVIHAHDALPFAVQMVRMREYLGIPVVATCHYFPSFVASYLTHHNLTNQMVEDLAWRYTIALYNRMEEVVFPTFTHRDRFVERGLISRTRVISNGVDIGRYCPTVEPLDTAERYGVQQGPRVLAVGRLAKDKNLETLIRAIADLRTTPPAQLLLVGEGPHREALEACARETGVAAQAHFLGFVPEEDLPRLYRAADVFAISSDFEVQSIPALQAAAAGLPIVAAAQGSLPEICRDGENGVLVWDESPASYAAALARALEPATRDRMGSASRALAAMHDEQVTFAAYESLYRQRASVAVAAR